MSLLVDPVTNHRGDRFIQLQIKTILNRVQRSSNRYTASQLVWNARAVSRQLNRRAQGARNPIMAVVTGRLPSLHGMLPPTINTYTGFSFFHTAPFLLDRLRWTAFAAA